MIGWDDRVKVRVLHIYCRLKAPYYPRTMRSDGLNRSGFSDNPENYPQGDTISCQRHNKDLVRI
jgi:hypothetical protein